MILDFLADENFRFCWALAIRASRQFFVIEKLVLYIILSPL